MADCDFILVEDRQTLRDCFPLLDEGVEAIEERCEQRSTIAADVFTAAVNCECDVRLIRVDLDVVGFLVTHANRDMTNNKRLFVWMLYLRPGTPDVMAEIVRELDLMALEGGCDTVEFSTVRPAWQRRLARYGYKPHTLMFSKEVRRGQE